MTNLNLLPEEYRPKGPVNLRNLSLILFSLLLAFTLITITIRLIGKSQGYTALLSDLRAQMIPYRKQYRDIQVAQEKLRVLEERLPLIEDLIRQRILWSQRLALLNQALPPDGLWFDSINVRLPQGPAEAPPGNVPNSAGTEDTSLASSMPWLDISGWTRELATLSAFLKAVERTPGFHPPVLLSTREAEVDGQMLLAFQCQVRLSELSTSESAESQSEEPQEGTGNP